METDSFIGSSATTNNIATTSLQIYMTNNTDKSSTPVSINPLLPCPRDAWELILWTILSLLIIISNAICIKLKMKCKVFAHPENRFFVINLAISNLFCGLALLITNSLDIMAIINAANLTLDICFAMCKNWAPIYIYCVMLPYATLAALSFDIAFYCHHSIDYTRRMSKTKLWSALASGWIYTLVVVGATLAARPKVLCDKSIWKIDIHFIILPVLLMFLPALVVVAIFIRIISNYWQQSHHLAKRMSIGQIGAIKEKKVRLVKKFVQKFLHLIIFSLICGLFYTVLTIIEVTVENQNNQRLCVIYRLDRLCISLNSLISPWIYCFGSKQIRSKLKRQYNAWWLNSASFSFTQQRKSTPSVSKHYVQDNANSQKSAPNKTVYFHYSSVTPSTSPKLEPDSSCVLSDRSATLIMTSPAKENFAKSSILSVGLQSHSLAPIKENELD